MEETIISKLDDLINKSINTSNDTHYEARLASFDSIKWFYRSDTMINKFICAKYGWMNCKKDTLKCLVCGNQLHFQLPKDIYQINEVNKHPEIIKFRSKIENGHKELCIFHENPTSEDIIEQNTSKLMEENISFNKKRKLSNAFETIKDRLDLL